MSRRHLAFFGSLFLGAALAAGCGGGGGSAGSPVVPSRSNGGATSVQVKIVVPLKSGIAGKRVPKFVSASTQSAVVLLFPAPSPSATVAPQANVGNNYANITPSSSECSTTSGATTCMISVAANITASGMFLVGVFTYDTPQTGVCSPLGTAAPCAGKLLSGSFGVASITLGSSNPVAVTLGGIPAFIQPIELLSGMIGGTSTTSNSQLTVFGPGQAQAQFELLDSDKNIILGAGAPTVIAASSSAALLATVATPGPTGLYTLTLKATTTVVGGQPIVTPTTVPINMSVLVPHLTVSPPITGFSVAIQHSVMYVARAVTPGVMTVDEFLDGNTTPAVSDYSAGDTQLGLAVDAQENLWIADVNNNDIVVFPLELPGATPSQAWTFCGIGSVGCTGAGHSLSTTFEDPTYLAFDDSGNLYVSAYSGSIYELLQYTAPSPGSTPNPAGGPAPYVWNGTAGIWFCHSTLDNNGHIYVGTSTPALNSFQIGLAPATVINSANINGIGWSPDGALWYLNQPVSGNDSAIKLNGSTFASVTTIAGIANNVNQGLAVDSVGNVYVATGAGTGVTEWTAASNWTAMSTFGNSLSPTYVAVYPDGLFGADSQVGVAKPNQTPSPIPTPSDL